MLNNTHPIALAELKELVQDFESKTSILINEPNFFDITGFPSRENVFSNVLKFYFDSRNHHGFGVQLIKALLIDTANIKDEDLFTIEIKREVVTENLKRIDLVIETNKYVIGIENKVYHILNNDLADYSNYLIRNYSKSLIKIVLNLTVDNNVPNEQGFIFVSYRTFIKNIEARGITMDESNKFKLFFNEFLKNIKNHFPTIMTKEEIQFVTQHEDTIEKIKELSNRTNNYIRYRAQEIFNHTIFNKNEWVKYQEVTYSFELHSKELPFIRVACTIEVSKIYIEGISDPDSFREFKEFLQAKNSTDIPVNHGWLYLKEFGPLNEISDVKVASEITQVLQLLEEFRIAYHNKS